MKVEEKYKEEGDGIDKPSSSLLKVLHGHKSKLHIY